VLALDSEGESNSEEKLPSKTPARRTHPLEACLTRIGDQNGVRNNLLTRIADSLELLVWRLEPAEEMASVTSEERRELGTEREFLAQEGERLRGLGQILLCDGRRRADTAEDPELEESRRVLQQWATEIRALEDTSEGDASGSEEGEGESEKEEEKEVDVDVEMA
jgi:hypothetical protein